MGIIYVIAIDGVESAWINSPGLFLRRITEQASSRGHTITPITTLQDFNALVESPPENVVVINAHGETVPLPTEQEGNWITFFRKIGNNVNDKGWIWVSVTRYPFYYYKPDFQRIPQPYMTGLATFISTHKNEVLVIPADNSVCNMSPQGIEALQKLGIQINTPIQVLRSFSWENVIPIPYLTSGRAHGASAIPMGRGFFVHCGIGSNDLGIANPNNVSDVRIADIVLAFTLFICERDLDIDFSTFQDNEDNFREHVVKPLLQRMGFNGIKTLHPREFGKDLVFYEQDKFEELKYYATQISVKTIHKNVHSRDFEQYAGTISNQINEAFSNPFIDPDTGEKHYVHESYVITSQNMTADAQELIRSQIGDKKGLVHFLDQYKILELIRRYH